MCGPNYIGPVKDCFSINKMKCELTVGGRTVKLPRLGGPVAHQLFFASGRFYFNSQSSAAVEPPVTITADEITVGCTSATREAIEALYNLFQKHYPTRSEVKVQ